MTENETKLVDNIIAKLNLYMDKNGKNLFALAKSFDFDYQIFYRLMRKTHIPTLSSLFTIADNLGYSIQELISDNVFTDIPVYKSYKNIEGKNPEFYCRLFLPYIEFKPYAKTSLFGISGRNSKTLNILYKINSFNSDGSFLVLYQSERRLIDVSSISSSFVIANLDGNGDIKIPLNQIESLAKILYHDINLLKHQVYGIKSPTK